MTSTPDGDATDATGNGAAQPQNGEQAEPTVADADEKAIVAITGDEARDMHIVAAWGRLMHQSGYFGDAKSAAQAAVKILAGRELGFSTVASMTGIHIIDGKPTIGAHLMGAAVKRSEKYDYRVREHTEILCSIEFIELTPEGPQIIGLSQFSVDDAALANINQRSKRSPDQPSMWEKYPRNMVFARAMSNGIAWYCPDVFEHRVYTPDEIRPDIELDERGEVLDVESFAVSPNEPTKTETPKPSETPSQRREQRPGAPMAPPDDLQQVEHLIRYAFYHHQWQPRQLAEFLGAENTGDIANMVETLFSGNFNLAAEAIDEGIAKGEPDDGEEGGEGEASEGGEDGDSQAAEGAAASGEGDERATDSEAPEASDDTSAGAAADTDSDREPPPPRPRTIPPDTGAEQPKMSVDA